MVLATVTPPWAYTLQLPQDPRAPGIARATLRSVLRVHGMGDLIDTAELLASELVTNAYRYSSGPYSLRLRDAGRHRIRLSVWDTNPDIPPPFQGGGKAPTALAECGRGLHLITLWADSWGAYPLRGGLPGHGGKLLWVECAWRPEEALLGRVSSGESP
ncbi:MULTISPECIES: ATP-binding protein [unclassified Streptomyces]|uniref:ATP-binding protein n=1 Tax=unclassified Streptomyces TaxID=2593676 RepID=UPI00224E70EB|nr:MULTISPECIES: ATP-binding protein [unclassified Streptomyces]MCX4533740.1 ATP-binding protein [Streptomyces sp. NBC_01669]WSA00862.1 ATP-binding protein [Streptomyces sp. NBC_00841]